LFPTIITIELIQFIDVITITVIIGGDGGGNDDEV
jgi:hypothetical protein